MVASRSGLNFVLMASGAVYSFGDGRTRALGHGSLREHVPTPRQIMALHDVRICQVCATGGCCLAVSEEGEVYGWGSVPAHGSHSGRTESTMPRCGHAPHKAPQHSMKHISMIDAHMLWP